MYKIYNTSKIYSVVLALFIILITGFYACKKDNITQSLATEALINDFAIAKKDISNSHFSQLKPNWNSLYSNDFDKEIFYEVELYNPNHLFMTNQSRGHQNGSNLERYNNIRLLIRKNKETGKTTFYYMSIISDAMNPDWKNLHYKRLTVFSGSVHYYSLVGRFINGWTYIEGKAVNKIQTINSKSLTQMSQSPVRLSNTVGCPIEVIDYYQTICSTGDGHFDTECVRKYIGSDHVFTNCGDDSSDNGDGDGGGGDVGGGDGGGNGDSPPAPTPQTINQDIIDSLQGYPCAQALLADMTTNTASDIARLIKDTFAKDDLVNITFGVDNSLVGTNIDGQEKQGNSSIFNAEFTVGLNPDVLNKSSKEYILVTMYHEALHAFFDRKLQLLGEVEFKRRYEGVDVSGGRLLGVPNDSHLPMAYQNYVKGLKDVIMRFNGSFNEDRAWALAKGGIIQLLPSEKTINDQEKDTTKPGFTGTKCF